MLYTNLTIKAMRMAYEAHKDQYDKGGMPYVFHPYHLAEQLDEENEICVALLHDVVEDTSVTVEDIAAEGFPKEVCDAVKLLTKDRSLAYLDYVRDIKNNPLAKKVKLLDLEHNSDPSRPLKDPEKKAALMDRYAKAKQILLEE